MQLDLLGWGRHGGRRAGAGRKPGRRPAVRHRPREEFRKGVLHVTSRVAPEIRTLRKRSLVGAIERCFRAACDRPGFRLAHYTVMHDHVHYIVEAQDRRALARGVRGLHVRVARAVNRVLARRGRVFRERFHVRRLRTPREVRNAIRYVLGNARKHGLGRRPGAPAIDPASSGRWFAHWITGPGEARDPPAVARPRFWLLTTGWLRGGALDPREAPGPAA